MCSGSKRWLLSASVGNIRLADSLESFDITIGYDRNVIRPTDVLREGTLSGQMSNGPTMNLMVQGEMRIFGFNVARSVAGDIPLLAVAGDYIGLCGSNSLLSVPYQPDFNAEFKRRYTVNVVEQVAALAIAKQNPLYGCRFTKDSLVLDSNQVSMEAQIIVDSNSASGGQRVVEIRELGQQDEKMVDVLEIKVDGQHRIDSTVAVQRTTRVFVSSLGGVPTGPMILSCFLRRTARNTSASIKLEASLRESDQCTCVIPGLKDTVSITVLPIVSVQSSFDEHACTFQVESERITGKCDHQKMKTLSVFDLFGRSVRVGSENENPRVEVSISGLPNGLYFVQMLCGNNQTVKSIVK